MTIHNTPVTTIPITQINMISSYKNQGSKLQQKNVDEQKTINNGTSTHIDIRV